MFHLSFRQALFSPHVFCSFLFIVVLKWSCRKHGVTVFLSDMGVKYVTQVFRPFIISFCYAVAGMVFNSFVRACVSLDSFEFRNMDIDMQTKTSFDLFNLTFIPVVFSSNQKS